MANAWRAQCFRRILEANREADTKRAAVIAILAAAGGAECSGKWEEIVERSAAVWIDAMASPERGIGQAWLEECRCVAVFGGTTGIFFLKTPYGTMTCRAQGGQGWEAARIVSLNGLRMSAPVPGTGPKLILLVMSERVAGALAAGRSLRFGRDVSPGDISAWTRSHGTMERVIVTRGSLGVEKRMSGELAAGGAAAAFVAAVEKYARISPSLRYTPGEEPTP